MKKPKKEEVGWVLCRTGNHMVRRNRIAVFYGPDVGLCGPCIVQRTPKVAAYWTEGRALDSAVDATGCKPRGSAGM